MKVIVGTRKVSAQPEVAGITWLHLQWVLGLREMGIDCYWVDRLQALKPMKHVHSLDYCVREFDRMAGEFGLRGRYCIDYNDGERHFGMSEAELNEVIDDTDVLLNISGYLPPESPLMRIPRRAYVDLDPGFTQAWAQTKDMGFDRHNEFFTVGLNVGRPEFTIDLQGLHWHTIVPPVVLSEWPERIDENCFRWGTIGDWRGKQMAVFDAEYLGGKREQYIRMIRVPEESGQQIELALCIGFGDHEDMGLLKLFGWKILDPYLYTGNVHSYREFIQLSRAEFSSAKVGYIKCNSGWISDRTACYLASGKPTLVPSTGAEWFFPENKGLVFFRTAEEAVEKIREINADYLTHCRAARRIAEEHCDSAKVISGMLELMSERHKAAKAQAV